MLHYCPNLLVHDIAWGKHYCWYGWQKASNDQPILSYHCQIIRWYHSISHLHESNTTDNGHELGSPSILIFFLKSDRLDILDEDGFGRSSHHCRYHSICFLSHQRQLQVEWDQMRDDVIDWRNLGGSNSTRQNTIWTRSRFWVDRSPNCIHASLHSMVYIYTRRISTIHLFFVIHTQFHNDINKNLTNSRLALITLTHGS